MNAGPSFIWQVFTTRMYQLTKNFIEIRRGRRGLLSLSLMLRRMVRFALPRIILTARKSLPRVAGRVIIQR